MAYNNIYRFPPLGGSKFLSASGPNVLSGFLRIMAPVLQTLVAPTGRISLRLLLLSQVSLTVCNYATHVRDVIFIVSRGVLFRVLFDDLDYFAAAGVESEEDRISDDFRRGWSGWSG